MILVATHCPKHVHELFKSAIYFNDTIQDTVSAGEKYMQLYPANI
jgi:hypothetical protein